MALSAGRAEKVVADQYAPHPELRTPGQRVPFLPPFQAIAEQAAHEARGGQHRKRRASGTHRQRRRNTIPLWHPSRLLTELSIGRAAGLLRKGTHGATQDRDNATAVSLYIRPRSQRGKRPQKGPSGTSSSTLAADPEGGGKSSPRQLTSSRSARGKKPQWGCRPRQTADQQRTHRAAAHQRSSCDIQYG